MSSNTQENDHLVPWRAGRGDRLTEHGTAVHDQAREVIPAQWNTKNDVNINARHERHKGGGLKIKQSDALPELRLWRMSTMWSSSHSRPVHHLVGTSDITLGISSSNHACRPNTEMSARGHLQAGDSLSKVDGGVEGAGGVDDGGEDACQIGPVAQLRPAGLLRVLMPHLPAQVNIA